MNHLDVAGVVLAAGTLACLLMGGEGGGVEVYAFFHGMVRKVAADGWLQGGSIHLTEGPGDW